MKKFQEKAIPLIVRHEGKKYEVNPQAIKFFASIEGKIAIISVAGVYRTGKSYLLNTIMLKQKAGFAVGPTTNPKTKGIWVWGKPLILKNQKDQIINVCVLDSEGLGSIEEDINHDLRLFSITLLLSSMFIYNTLGAIDENAIDSLGLVLRLCEHLKAQNYNDFPDFYWVLRDFSLALVGKDNKPLTPNKYLQNALSAQPGDSEVRNKIRNSIRSSFTNRTCFTFVRPLTDQSCLQNLQKMQIDQLRPEFMEQVIDFRKLINGNIKTKKIKGKEINSELLIELIHIYVAQINGKELPQIETGWKYVCSKECEQVISLIEKQADDITSKLLDNLPTTKKELSDKKEAIYDCLKKTFDSKTQNNDQAATFLPEIAKIVQRKIQRIEEEMRMKNSMETKNFIKKEFENIERRLKQNEFKSMGELAKQFEVFYEYYRKKCPYKDEIQTGLEFLIKKFSDCSLIMFKSMKTKKDQELNKLKDDLDRMTSELTSKDEKHKHQKTANSDKHAIAESKIDELTRQIKELSDKEMKMEEQYEKLKMEHEESKHCVNEQMEMELITLRKRLMEAQDVLREMECKKTMEINNFKNVIMLREGEIAHLQEEKLVIANKLSALSHDLSTEREDKQRKYEQLSASVQLLKTENDNLKKNYEQKINNRDIHIARLQNCVESKSMELANVLQQNERTFKTLLQNCEQEKAQVVQSTKEQIKGLKDIIQCHEDDLSIKIKRAQADFTQKEMDLKMHRLEVDRQVALMNQKIEFLRRECEEKDERVAKLIQESTCYMNMYEEKDNELTNTTNLLEELKNNSDCSSSEMSVKVQQLTLQLQEKTREINRLENVEEKFSTQIREKGQQIKGLNDRLRNLSKNYEQKVKELNEKLSYEMELADRTKLSLETQIEGIKTQNSKNMEDQKRNAELSLVQLKNYYEMERERLEKKNLEERKKHEYSESTTTSELENRHRKVHRSLQEEIQQLRLAKENLEEQLSRVENDCELKILNIQEQRQNQKRLYSNRSELLTKKYEQLQTDFEQFQKNYEEERITFVKKIEGLNFELSRKEKQLMQSNSKRQSLENMLTKKDTQLDNMKKLMNQQIEGSLKKVSDIQLKYQKLNEEYMQIKIESEKQIALSKQRNEFLNAKLQEMTKEKEFSSSKNIDKLDKQKIGELKDQNQKYKTEIMSLEGKVENYRKTNKDLQTNFKKQMNALEKENEFLNQKLEISEAKITDLQAKMQQKTEAFLKQLEDSRAKNTVERQLIQKECDQLRERISSVEDEKNSVAWNLQKDIALLNERMKYAEYQRDQTKKQLQESEKRLQQTFGQLKKATEKANEESEAKKNNSDKKYTNQIDNIRDLMKNKADQYEQTIKRQKDDIKLLKEKNIELADKIQGIDKTRSTERSLQQETETLKRQKDILMTNYRSERARENEEWKKKFAEIEKKCKEMERKNMEYVFAIEKENSKWSMERQNLQEKIRSLEDSIEWERNKSQLNKSKHELKKSESSSMFSKEYSQFSIWKS